MSEDRLLSNFREGLKKCEALLYGNFEITGKIFSELRRRVRDSTEKIFRNFLDPILAYH
jgi:hypothetical protein